MKTTLLVFLVALVGCHDHDHDHEELTPGASDALALRACAARSDAAERLEAAADAANAPLVVVAPETSYEIDVTGTGYVTFRSDVEHFDWAIFTEGAADVGLADLSPQSAVPSGCNSALLDHRVHVHAAQDFLMQIEGEGTVWLYTASSASAHAGSDASIDGGHAHGDAGPDGGHAHEDAGHAHDAGHSHEDAGHAHEDAGHAHEDAGSADGGHMHGDAGL